MKTATRDIRPGFDIHVLPEGVTLRTGANQTLLSAVRAAGIPNPSSCIMGYCGSCRAGLRTGVVEYPSGRRVSASDPVPPDDIMLCIARARSDLTIELRFPPQNVTRTPAV